MKQSSSLLRAIGLSAGLIASAAMMPSVHAATSGTITASGTIVAGVCEVSGANVRIYPSDSTNKTLEMREVDLFNRVGSFSTNGVSTTISLSQTTVVGPVGANAIGTITASFITDEDLRIGSIQANSTSGGSFVISQDWNPNYPPSLGMSGGYEVQAAVQRADRSALPAGDYSLGTTITCLTN